MYYNDDKTNTILNERMDSFDSDYSSGDNYYRKKAVRRKAKKRKTISVCIVAVLLVITVLSLFAFISGQSKMTDTQGSEAEPSPIVIIEPEHAETPVSVIDAAPRQSEEEVTSGQSFPVESSFYDIVNNDSTEYDLSSNIFRHRRSLLSASDAEQYDRISSAIGNYSPSIRFSGISPGRMMDIAQLVYYDYPEYFWFEGDVRTSYTERLGSYSGELIFNYGCSKTDKIELETRLREKTVQLISDLHGASEYDTVKRVYKYIVDNTVYDSSVRDQTCISVLLNGKGVCAGYASAFHYLMNKTGIDCLRVEGRGRNENHAWNIVKVNGEWYYVDCTWGDPVMPDHRQTLSYNYLLVNDDEILKDHSIIGGVNYPVCAATSDNYYIHEGYYIDKYDLEQIKQICKQCLLNGDPVCFKCSTTSVFQETKYNLFDEDEVWKVVKYLGGSDTSHINYSTDDIHRTIELVI